MSEASNTREGKSMHTDCKTLKWEGEETGKADRDQTRSTRSSISASTSHASTNTEDRRRTTHQQNPNTSEAILNEVTTMHESLVSLGNWVQRVVQGRTATVENDNAEREKSIRFREKALAQNVQDIEAKNKSLSESYAALKKENDCMHKELADKSAEIQNLHNLIIQGGHRNPEKSDQEISALFSTLEHKIKSTVLRHFQGSALERRTIAEIDVEDRALLIRSWLASGVMIELLHPELRPFGLEIRLEKTQQKLEEYFVAEKVPKTDIDAWRIATVTAAASANRRWLSDVLSQIATSFVAISSNVVMIRDHQACFEDTLDLVQHAWMMAVTLRSGKAEYKWDQPKWDQFRSEVGEYVAEDDVERIEYCVTDPKAPRRMIGVLFAPVYKVFDDELLLIRKGQVLVSN